MKNTISENIEKYNNIYKVFYDWHMLEWASRFLRLFMLVAAIVVYVFVCPAFGWKKTLACIFLIIWAIVCMIKVVAFGFSIQCFDVMDGIFDKEIKMLREGFKRYDLVPTSEDYIMIVKGDIVGLVLKELDASIARGIQFRSPYMMITDSFIISRSDMSFQDSPVAIPKDKIGEITYFDKGVFQFMNINISQILDDEEPIIFTRVVGKKGRFSRKKVKIGDTLGNDL